ADATVAASARAVGRALRDGLGALASFVGEHPGANVAGGGVLALGAVAGWGLTAPHGVTLAPPGDPGSAFGAVPVGPFLDIAANNWLVAAGTGYGGLAVGLPTAAALLFNGALVGALLGLFDPVVFLGLVAPHGVVELPAIAVAGGLGFHLGRVGWEAVRGRRSAAAVGDELGEAFRVLVGLAVVFVVAAGIEAFVTPLVGAAVLG
ncbi:MAG: stage II sporulation protein M, partial [Haloferacaceae archaeon]